MRDSFYLARRYLVRSKFTTAILVGAMTLIFFLPAALRVVVDGAVQHFRSRGNSTPLIVGARGSALELVLGTLYFDEPQPEIMRMSQLERVRSLGLGTCIPMHAGIRMAETPVVGTSQEYFRLRDVTVAVGRTFEMAGECLVGTNVARRMKLAPETRFPVTRQKAFALGDAPLRLNVAGILARTETPDDDAIFVNLKTAWIIEGLGHGHAAGAPHGSAESTETTDITKDNVDSFHFHGDESKFPITAIIVEPENAKARALLLGEFLSPEDPAQIVRPEDVMNALLAKVLTVRSYIFSIVALVSLVTLTVLALVIMLSIRLRRRELMTMTKMGCSRSAIGSILGSQIAIIILASAILATMLTALVALHGQEFVRQVVLR